MASLSDITIKRECRACYVANKKAMFHTWSHEKEVIGPSPMVGGHNGGEIARTLGIVEFEDGSVKLVHPERIKFADGGDFYKTAFLPPEEG